MGEIHTFGGFSQKIFSFSPSKFFSESSSMRAAQNWAQSYWARGGYPRTQNIGVWWSLSSNLFYLVHHESRVEKEYLLRPSYYVSFICHTHLYADTESSGRPAAPCQCVQVHRSTCCAAPAPTAAATNPTSARHSGDLKRLCCRSRRHRRLQVPRAVPHAVQHIILTISGARSRDIFQVY